MKRKMSLSTFVTASLGFVNKNKIRLSLFVVLFFSLVLIVGCGKGAGDSQGVDSDGNPNLPGVISVVVFPDSALANDSFKIDLKTDATTAFNVVTSFSDASEKTQLFTASWDANEAALSILDGNNDNVKIEYDVNQLVVALADASLSDQKTQQVSTTVLMTGDKFIEPVEVIIVFIVTNEVVPEASVASVSFLLPQAFSTDFIVGDNTYLKIKAKKDNDTFVEDALSLVSCSAKNDVVVFVERNCQLTAMAEGEVNITIVLLADENISANITIKVLPKPVQNPIPIITPIVISTIIPASIDVSLYENDVYQLAVKTQYSDGSFDNDALSLLNCSVANNDVIQLTANCELTAVGVGTVDVLFKDKNNAQISATLTITILPPYLSRIYFSVEQYPLGQVSIEMGKELQLILSGDLSNGDAATEDLFQWVRCTDTSDYFNVTDRCNLTAINKGVADVTLSLLDGVQTSISSTILLETLSVAISEPVTIVELIVIGADQLWVDNVQQYALAAKLSNGDVIDDARNIAKCISTDAAIIVEDNCLVTGSVIGSGNVSAILNNPESQLSIPLVSTKLIAVIEAPDTVDSQLVSVVAGSNVEYSFVTNLQSTYKVKLFSDTGLPIEANISLEVYIGFDIQCSNKVAAGKKSLACGVDTTGTAGEIVVVVDNLSSNDNFSGTLVLSFDNDILNNDDGGQITPVSIGAYQLLTTDGATFNGHVSVNIAGANVSRYRTDESNGLLSAATGYQVKVVFEPDFAGDYHFDLFAVQVGWEYGNNVNAPVIKCTAITCSCRLAGVDSIVCDVVEGGKTDLFVTVFGNDPNDVIPSSATADGELSYGVSIINNAF